MMKNTKVTFFVVAAMLASVACIAPRVQAQTFVKSHASALILPGSGTDITHTMTITAPSLSGNPSITLPGASLVFPATNGSGVLTNDGSGTLTWTPAATGSVTAVSVASANGFAGSSSGGATPALTISTSVSGLLKGNGTAISAATSGTDYSAGTSALSTGILKSTTTTGALTIAVAADFPTLNQNTTGSAASFTGSLAGDVTGTQGATSVGKILGNTVPANAAGVLTNNGTGTLSWTSPSAGSVTAVSVASANGFAGSSSGGSTPALTISTSVSGLLKGNGTAISAATSGTDYSAGTSALSTGILKSTTTTGALTIAVAADFPTLNQNTTGSAASFTGSLAGDVTGTQGATSVGKLLGNSIPANAAGALTNNGTGTLSWSPALTDPMTTTGDIIYSSNNSGTATRLAIGGSNTVLAGGTTPHYVTLGTDTSLVGNGIGTSFGVNLGHSDSWTVPQYFAGAGINTTTPAVGLDINSDYATRATTNSSTGATLNNISTLGTSNITITSEAANFTITGFANGHDGKHLRIYNKSGHNMTIANESASSTLGNRINTLAGADITLVGAGSVEFVYDSNSSNEWVAASTLATQVTGIVGTPQNLLRATNKSYSSGTLTNDTDFAWSTGKNETWEVDGVLDVIGSSSTATLGISINSPGTPAPMSIAVNGLNVGTSASNGIGTALLTTNGTVISPDMSVGSKESIIYVHGVFTTDTTTAGTTYFQFNLNGGTGSVTVQSHSYLRVTRLF